MTLMNALYSGVTGLSANGLSLGVIGDNIANVNTVGFKSARAVFGDILSQLLPGSDGVAQLGRGVGLMDIEQEFSQGSYENTTRSLDLAINGQGFFVVRGTHNGQNDLFYTRAGNFDLDNEGFLVNAEGMRVQGYPQSGDGSIGSNLGDLRIGGYNAPPRATTQVDVSASFCADQAVQAFDETDPDHTGTLLHQTTVYDSLGQSHVANIYVNRTAAGWDYHVMMDGGELAGGVAGTQTQVVSGSLVFDAEGKLTSDTQNPGAFSFANGSTANQPITFNFGESVDEGGDGANGSRSNAPDKTEIVTMHQDGLASGILSSLRVDPDGSIVGGFSNGSSRVLGQVALGAFQNERGLDRVGNNLWVQTPDSGDVALGGANQQGRGSLLSNSLEQSNVDITREFVSMIAAQRAFQANSRTVTTADQLLNEVISMKR